MSVFEFAMYTLRDCVKMFACCIFLLFLASVESNPSPVLGDVVVDKNFIPKVCAREAKNGDHVRYHYNATFLDGKTFDSRWVHLRDSGKSGWILFLCYTWRFFLVSDISANTRLIAVIFVGIAEKTFLMSVSSLTFIPGLLKNFGKMICKWTLAWKLEYFKKMFRTNKSVSV